VQLRHAIRAGRQRRRRLVDQPCDGEVARERLGPPRRALLHRKARTRRAHRRRRALGRVRRRGIDGGGGAGSVGRRRGGGGEHGADVEADARGFGVQAEGEVVEGAVAALGQDGVEDQLRRIKLATRRRCNRVLCNTRKATSQPNGDHATYNGERATCDSMHA
jgi:hypothetical protein